MRHFKAFWVAAALPVALVWCWAETPPAADVAKPGAHVSGKWTYTLEVRQGGPQTEMRTGRLSYDGRPVPGHHRVNDYIRTPWGVMYWVGKRTFTWGEQGWMPQPAEGAKRVGREWDAAGSPSVAGETPAQAYAPAAASPPSGPGQKPSGAPPPPAPLKPAMPAQEIVAGKEAAGRFIEAEVGQIITIKLPGNPTTGYEWVAVGPDDDAVAESGPPEYAADAKSEEMTGVGGVYYFHYRAERTGAAKLLFHYRRSWEKDPAELFSVMVRVTKVKR